jgi:hypothetical protein
MPEEASGPDISQKAWQWLRSGIRPNGRWELSPGFILGKASNATSPEGATELSRRGFLVLCMIYLETPKMDVKTESPGSVLRAGPSSFAHNPIT